MNAQPTGSRSRTVLITGASSGIGADAALYFNERGYTVFAGVRRLEDGERVRARSAHPERFLPLRLDVTDADQVLAARDEVAGRLETAGLDALVSNAGVASLQGDVSCEGCPIEVQQHVMEVNHFGAVRVLQAFLPLIRVARGTVVINSALMAHTVLPFSAGYAMSKAALESWADSLRREVAPLGVRVAIIQAAEIKTELAGKQDPSRIPTGTAYPAQRAFLGNAAAMEQRFSDRPSAAPRRVSERMLRAVESRRPPVRQIVGAGARPIWVLGCLPDRVQDAVFATGLRLLSRRDPG